MEALFAEGQATRLLLQGGLGPQITLKFIGICILYLSTKVAVLAESGLTGRLLTLGLSDGILYKL